MAEIKLFKIGSEVKELKSGCTTIEKELQNIIEKNMFEFGVRFLQSEFRIDNGRMDSIGIDENNCPVIFEYKCHSNENVINQGLFYLNWLLEHKANFKLLVIEKLGIKEAEEIENQIESLEKKILVEKCKTNIKIPENTIREYYSKVLEHQSMMLINTLIKVIILYDDKIEITFNKPMPKSPDDNQGFLFYTETNQILHSYQNRCNIINIRVNFYL